MRIGKGFRFTFGYTVDDQEIVKDLRAMTRVALVTGGGTGIGAAVARRLAVDGYAVAVTGRRPGPIEEIAAEVDGLAIVADTGLEADAEHAVAATVARFGGLDALVLNAGIGGSGNLLELDPDTFEEVLRTNVTGAFLTARAAIPIFSSGAARSSASRPSPAFGQQRRASPTARRRQLSRC